MAPKGPKALRDYRPQDEVDNHPNDWYRNFNPDFKIVEQALHTRRKVRILIIGAGAGGLLAAYKAARQLSDVTFAVYEKNDDIGGTWYENRYPGVESDSPSHTYQWTFHRNPAWSKFMAPGMEIWQYLKDWAVESDILKDVKLNHRVESAVWHDGDGIWEIKGRRSGGESFSDRGDILISVNGGLNKQKLLDVPGIEKFKGTLVHSGAWPKDLDVAGKTVAVIGGAGASGVQIVPSIQPAVGKLVVYLRSKFWAQGVHRSPYVGDTKTNFQYSKDQIEHFKQDPKLQEAYQRDVEHDTTFLFEGFHRGSRLHDLIVQHFREGTVRNFGEENAERFTPDYGFGCRRSLPAPGYADTLQRENVEMVQAGVVGFTETGIIDSTGSTRDVDIAVCATSFKAFSPSYVILGKDGRNLDDQIQSTGKSYLSLMNDGFPNHFYIPSPNAPVNHGSFLPMLEAYMHYAFQVIAHVQRTSIKSLSPKPAAVDDYFVWSHELLKRQSVAYPCHSWFKGGHKHGPAIAVYAGSRTHFYEGIKDPRYEDFDVEYLGNRFTFFGNGVTQSETTRGADAVWYLKMLQTVSEAGKEAYDSYPVRPMGPPADKSIVIPKLETKESKL